MPFISCTTGHSRPPTYKKHVPCLLSSSVIVSDFYIFSPLESIQKSVKILCLHRTQKSPLPDVVSSPKVRHPCAGLCSCGTLLGWGGHSCTLWGQGAECSSIALHGATPRPFPGLWPTPGIRGVWDLLELPAARSWHFAGAARGAAGRGEGCAVS